MVSLRLKEEHTTLADYLCTMLCPLSPRRTVDPISPFGRSLAQSLDSEGLTTLQVEWSDDLVDVCAARDIERLALVQFERWEMGVRGTRTTDYTYLDLPPHLWILSHVDHTHRQTYG